MVRVEDIIKALQPSEKTLITVEPCGGKVLITVETVKKRHNKKHTKTE
jgi:hypothetical protein